MYQVVFEVVFPLAPVAAVFAIKKGGLSTLKFHVISEGRFVLVRFVAGVTVEFIRGP